MEGSPLIEKSNPKMSHKIVENAKVTDFITPSRCWDINPLINTLPDHIINKIKAISIPVSLISMK